MKINKLTIALTAAIVPALSNAGNALSAEELQALMNKNQDQEVVQEISENTFIKTDKYRNILNELELEEQILIKKVAHARQEAELQKQKDLLNKSEIKQEIEKSVRAELQAEYDIEKQTLIKDYEDTIIDLKNTVVLQEEKLDDLIASEEMAKRTESQLEEKMIELISIIKDQDEKYNLVKKEIAMLEGEPAPTVNEIAVSGISGNADNLIATIYFGGNKVSANAGDKIFPELGDITVSDIDTQKVTVVFNGVETVMEPMSKDMAIQSSVRATSERYMKDASYKIRLAKAEKEYEESMIRFDKIMNPEKYLPKNTNQFMGGMGPTMGGVPMSDATQMMPQMDMPQF